MLAEFLKSFQLLSDDEIQDFIALCTKRNLNKHDYLIKEGETSKEVAFIVSGTFRSFYSSSEGEDITYCITFPNNFITAYSSLITGQPSSENIQAVTPAELLVISKQNIEQLSARSVNWLNFSKTIAEFQYLDLEKRLFQFQRDSAVTRYKNLIENHPQYIQNIPLNYLSSYLGITQRHLSRIRKEITF